MTIASRLYRQPADDTLPTAVGNNIVNSQANNVRIAALAREFGIDAFIIAHPGQFGPLGNGPLADTLEAIIGAVWQDSQNLAAVTQVMQTLTYRSFVLVP